MTCSDLTNEELLASLKQLVAHERDVVADVVEHLAEVDARKLYIPAACSSLTTYCIEVLGYSEFEAAHRVRVARLVRDYPVILPMLRSGDLNLSTLRTLAPVLTAENHRERLEAAIGRTRSDVERLVAGWVPKPDVPTRITPVVTEDRPVLLERMQAAAAPNALTLRAAAPRAAQVPCQSDGERAGAATPTPPAPVSIVPAPRPAPLPKPLTPERYNVQLTVDRETYENIMRLRDHLRHTIPDGDIAKIVARAVKDLRSSVEARKFGKRKTKKVNTAPASDKHKKKAQASEEPTTATTMSGAAVPDVGAPLVGAHPSTDAQGRHKACPYEDGSTHRPQSQSELFPEPVIEDDIIMKRAPGLAMRREIAERDQYQCCFVSDDGRRCSSTAWLEYDHHLEWALNGPTWKENLQLLCRAHHRAKHSPVALHGTVTGKP